MIIIMIEHDTTRGRASAKIEKKKEVILLLYTSVGSDQIRCGRKEIKGKKKKLQLLE